MDNPNMTEEQKKIQADALKILSEKGYDAFVKHVFTNKETGKPLSYSEMRERYG